jgi:HEAT repeat protein
MTEAETLIPYLYSYDAREAAVRLAQLGAPAIEPLIAVMSGQYPTPDFAAINGKQRQSTGAITAIPNADAARERAAYILGEIGDTRAVDSLIAAYRRESDRYIQLAAARALGRIGDERGIEVLTDALAGRLWTPDFRFLVDDLARLAGERAIPTLAGLLRRDDHTYGCAALAAGYLLRYRGDPRVVDGLIGGLRADAEFATVRAAVSALTAIGGAQANRGLLAFVEALAGLPPERWDEREDNLSETEQGVIFHVLRTELADTVQALRGSGDADTIAALDRVLADAPRLLE